MDVPLEELDERKNPVMWLQQMQFSVCAFHQIILHKKYIIILYKNCACTEEETYRFLEGATRTALCPLCFYLMVAALVLVVVLVAGVVAGVVVLVVVLVDRPGTN